MRIKIALIAALCSISAANIQASVCVLSFEREAHFITRLIKPKVQESGRVHFLSEANPDDLFECLTVDFEEVTLVAHAIHFGSTAAPLLGYFERIADEDRLEYLSKAKAILQSEVAKREGKQDRKSRTERRALLKELDVLRVYPAGDPLYRTPQPLLPRFFERVAERLRQSPNHTLKRLRIVSCAPQQIIARYPQLTSLLAEQGVVLETAPLNLPMSWLRGEPLSSPDPRWILDTAQYDDPLKDGDTFYVYLKLKTLGAYRYGETLALRGKYRVRVRGAALGLDSRWTQLFIKYRDVENLGIGASKTILVPHLTLAASVGIGVDIGFSPKPRFLLPTELNSAGVSLGLFSRVDIKRVY